jgi:hypothetical protein
VLHTAGPDIRLTVTPDRVEIRADDTDLAFLDITIADRDGIPYVLQDRTLTVSIKRPQIMGEEHGSKRYPKSKSKGNRERKGRSWRRVRLDAHQGGAHRRGSYADRLGKL